MTKIQDSYFNPLQEVESDLEITEVGYQYKIPGRVCEKWSSEYAVFQYVISGKGKFSVKGKSFLLTQGDLFYIPAFSPCEYTADIDDPYDYYFIGVRGKKIDNLLQMCNLTLDSPTIQVNSPDVLTLFKQTLDFYSCPTQFSLIRSLGNVYAIISKLIEIANSAVVVKPNAINFVELAKQFMQKNYMDDITIEDVANSVAFNRNYFSRIFKEVTTMTPINYLISYRLFQATLMLKTTTLSIMEVSIKCGFPNIENFSKRFSEYHGISPRAYRTKNSLSIITR